MALRLGTEHQQAATGSAEWYRTRTTGLPRLLGRVVAAIAPRLSRIGPDGIRGVYPCGVGHAVPEESVVALCGAEPAFLWAGSFDPHSRVVPPCPRCLEALDEAPAP